MKIMFQVTIVVSVICKCGYDEYENYVIAEFPTVKEAIDFASKSNHCKLEIDKYAYNEETHQWGRPHDDDYECLGFTDGEMEYHDK